ncbi:PilW family protein [Aeromonas sanarellii]|uniref:PilW family protein n=1 Tax=Aeromonas sanarellii TaxID=633415 RepID=UPI002DBC0DED|nr:prepilin-type N-terminal cleavage/methylation domain-containing protein [Aeromonas sanarellii]MEB6607657.1 prepilin-type N-terminal cleavage/methylation domain-containing protein [Aeromonas sanarellii]
MQQHQLIKNRGFSLVELMVAMVAGLLLVAAVSALFATIIKSNRTAMQVSRLNQELQAVTDMIARDIQRAGYDASAAAHTLVSGAASPFSFHSSSTADLASNCIRVKYDNNADGVPDNNETRMYSYSDSEKGVALKVGSTTTCVNLEGTLLNTKDTIEITGLSFTEISGSVSTGARTIRLTISGNDIKSPALALTLQRDIKLRNDGF